MQGNVLSLISLYLHSRIILPITALPKLRYPITAIPSYNTMAMPMEVPMTVLIFFWLLSLCSLYTEKIYKQNKVLVMFRREGMREVTNLTFW